jgi:hypothetical protein
MEKQHYLPFLLLALGILTSCGATPSVSSSNPVSSSALTSSGAETVSSPVVSSSLASSGVSEDTLQQIAHNLYNSFFRHSVGLPQYLRDQSEFPSLLIDKRYFLSNMGKNSQAMSAPTQM